MREIQTILALCLLSCSSPALMDEGMKLSVEYSSDGIADNVLFNGCSSVIPLSLPNQEAAIKSIDKVLFFDDRIYIVDRDSKKLLAFDRNGNFIASTAKYIGHGRNEYTRFTDATIDKKEKCLYMFRDGSYAIMKFDMDLQLIETIPVDYFICSLENDDEYIYGVDHNNQSKGETGDKLVCVSKKKLKKSEIMVTSYNGALGMCSGGRYLTTSGGSVFACLPFDHAVYQLRKGKVTKMFTLDFGKYAAKGLDERLDYDSFWKKNDELNTETFVRNITVSDSLMLFNTNREYIYAINRIKNTCHAFYGVSSGQIPVFDSQIIPSSGLERQIVFGLEGFVLNRYLSERKNINEAKASPLWKKAIDRYDGKGNPILILWNLK